MMMCRIFWRTCRIEQVIVNPATPSFTPTDDHPSITRTDGKKATARYSR
jgi:hypothetical protein